MKILVRHDAVLTEWPKKRVQLLFNIIQKHVNIPVNAEISIVFTNDTDMIHLNKNYRNTDQTTDVLAFAMLEETGKPFVPETVVELFTSNRNSLHDPIQLGDIIISVNQAKKQSHEMGNSLDREIAILLIHGLLHLLGYDDMEEKNKQDMWNYQNQLLEEVQQVWNSVSIPREGE